MTTYPLSEPATVYATGAHDDTESDVMARGTLEECVDIIAALEPDKRQAISIRMDELDLRFGPDEVAELIRFLHEESAGISNAEIAETKNPDD